MGNAEGLQEGLSMIYVCTRVFSLSSVQQKKLSTALTDRCHIKQLNGKE